MITLMNFYENIFTCLRSNIAWNKKFLIVVAYGEQQSETELLHCLKDCPTTQALEISDSLDCRGFELL